MRCKPVNHHCKMSPIFAFSKFNLGISTCSKVLRQPDYSCKYCTGPIWYAESHSNIHFIMALLLVVPRVKTSMIINFLKSRITVHLFKPHQHHYTTHRNPLLEPIQCSESPCNIYFAIPAMLVAPQPKICWIFAILKCQVDLFTTVDMATLQLARLWRCCPRPIWSAEYHDNIYLALGLLLHTPQAKRSAFSEFWIPKCGYSPPSIWPHYSQWVAGDDRLDYLVRWISWQHSFCHRPLHAHSTSENVSNFGIPDLWARIFLTVDMVAL